MSDIPPPAIQMSVPIVVPDQGTMTSYFSDWLTRILTQIINLLNTNTSSIASLQATQAQLIATIAQLTAVQQAQQSTSGTSGSGSNNVNVAGSTWVGGPTINLTGVVAGNLTYPGSGPTQINTTQVNPSSGVLGTFTGDWRIQEIVGASETTVFSGTYTAQRARDDTGIENIAYNNSDTSGSVARTSTGAVSYRLDVNAIGFEVVQLQANLYVRRA